MDIQQAKELKSSLMWAGVVEEMDKKIVFEVAKLKAAKLEDIILIQATIRAYESLKKLPDDVIEREE